jgi:Bacterial HORMA domain 2
MTSTRSVVGTLTRTEAFLAGKTAYAFQAILFELGLSRAALDHDWDDVEEAMQVWLSEGSLNGVDMEIRRRGTTKVLACFEVDIVYDNGEATMRHDAETARLAARKVADVACGQMSFRVFMRTASWRTPVDGWSRGPHGDRTNLRRRAVGELARGPGMSSQLNYSR